MADAPILLRADPARYGPGYEELRNRGVALVQELAGDTWTDYNEHDPGVTILEQLVYALTEVSYRAGLPVSDLLAGADGSIDPGRHALFPPTDAFPSRPLTPDDYRRLIADQVPAVGHLWVTPLPRASGADAVNGLYDVDLHVPGAAPGDDAVDPRDVCEQVRRVYASNRNLCEDLHAVRVLAQVPTVVRAVVTVDDSRAPEAILAELLFKVGLFLAPEIRREPLSARVARGLAPSEIFEGPLLRDGFVGDAELGRMADRVRIPDIAHILARTSGVLAVREVSAHAGCAVEASGKGEIAVPPRSILTLDTRPGSGGDSSIQIVRRGARCKVEHGGVRRELDRRWKEQRRRYPLDLQHDPALALPRGRAWDLAEYTSIQNHFPDLYGINANGPPDGATALRRAQAKQLKGYLIVFEQLLADFFAQLARVKDLYSTDATLAQTYFHGSLSASVPDAAEVLAPGYEQALDTALRDADPALDRRNRFLDVLLGLHADGLDLPAPAGGRLVQAKLALLEQLVALQRDRGGGFDAMAASSARSLAGMEIRSRIELGLPAGKHRRLYIVEHTLLRFGRRLHGEGRGCHPEKRRSLAYSFTVTAVLPHAQESEAGAAFEASARAVLRRNAPAHVVVEYRFLHPDEMRRFEELWRAWRHALRRPGPRAIILASVRLRRFLEQHGPRP